MDDAQLRRLRRRAAQALDEIQALPAFKARFAALPDPPDWARDWSWDAVVTATESDRWRPGRVRWEQALSAQRPPEPLVGSTASGRLPLDEDGSVLLPADEPLPGHARRSQLAAYRAAVVEFAERFVLNAQWSARAVHDALRLDQPIRLPDRPEPFVALPLAEPFTLDPNQPLPRSWVIELADALRAAANTPAAADRRTRAPRGADRSEATSGADRSERMPGEAVWRGAVNAMRIRLDGGAVPTTPRQQARRVRRWLDAAVSGELNAPPLLEADDPGYPARRRARRGRPVVHEPKGQGR